MSDSDASSAIASARTITIIIAGAAVVVGTILLVAVLGMLRERKLRREVEQQAERVRYLKGLMAGNSNAPTFQTLEDLMKPYKKHLLQSAFDLQSRLNGQLSSTFLYDFNQRGDRDRAYAIDSTTYFFAEFFGWLEVIRRQVVFITGSEYAESLNSLLDSIRFQLTGETPIQGCTRDCKKNNDSFDQHSGILQLYIVDIRSIGNAMLHKVDNLLRPITVDTFLQYMNSDDPRHRAFKLIMDPLHSSLSRLSELDSKAAPIRRIAIFQVLLCKLIDILDNSVPWDFGPKFDGSEEPRYIQRDMRMTPGVRFLSNIQKSHLQSMPFFDDDPNLSFPGFREDMKNKPQDFRDEKLWPGACPPQEPRQRDVEYKMPDQYAHIGARAVMTWPMGLRRRPKKNDSANSDNRAGDAGTPPVPLTLSQLRRIANHSDLALQRPSEVTGAAGRLAARNSSNPRREDGSTRLPANGRSRGLSLSPAYAQSQSSSKPSELAVNVHRPDLPGSVPRGNGHAHASGSGSGCDRGAAGSSGSIGQSQQSNGSGPGPGPGSVPGSGSGPGSGAKEVLARAELPLSPGRSIGGVDDVLPPEHLSSREPLANAHAGQTT